MVTGPELDDRQLHRTLTQLRPSQQMHGLGAGSSHPLWEPVAELLRATGRDWDRRVHRISVLARGLPPVVVDRWVKDRPRDPDALVMRACARVARTKSTHWSDAWDVYGDCRRAAEAAPEDPTPWLAVLWLMYACGSPVHATVPVWTEAVTRDPWNRAAYNQMLRHLSPRGGHGTLMEMIDFARRCALQAPHGSPVALLPLAARVELVAYRSAMDSATAFTAEGHWYEPQATAEADAALSKWFHAEAQPHAEALADLNLLAFALIRMKRTAESAPVFRRIGRNMTSHPWDLGPDAVSTFQYWSDRARA